MGLIPVVFILGVVLLVGMFALVFVLFRPGHSETYSDEQDPEPRKELPIWPVLAVVAAFAVALIVYSLMT